MIITNIVSMIELLPGDKITILLPGDVRLDIESEGGFSYIDFMSREKSVNYFTDSEKGLVIDKNSQR